MAQRGRDQWALLSIVFWLSLALAVGRHPEGVDSTLDDVYLCRQHSHCGSCVAGSSFLQTCSWCELDQECHGHPAISRNHCTGNQSIANRSQCPPEQPRQTNFSLDTALQMATYANAAYYDEPAAHGVPESFQVITSFNFSIGTWQKAYGFVGVDREAGHIVVSCRGTDSVTQLAE